MEFAKALGVKGTKKDGYLEDGDTLITWCYGHLVTMCYPADYDPSLKTWSLDTLPFIPATYKYQPIPEAHTKKQYRIIQTLLNRKDVSAIYYSGDSAREGEYIQRLIRQLAGRNKDAQEFRVWIDSQTKEEIQRGIREAKPLSFYDKLSDSAYARAIEDYLAGINFSRSLSLKYADIANQSSPDGKRHPVAVGRVMSCTLGMIVDLEREIRNAVVKPVYGISADIGNSVIASWKIMPPSPYAEDPDNYGGIGLLNKEKTQGVLQELTRNGTLTVQENKHAIEKKAAPLLYNLAELQADCSKKLKISPQETLNYAQDLYEKKLITYPRTDARVLTRAVQKVISANVIGLAGDSKIGSFAHLALQSNLVSDFQSKTSRFVNDAKVSDHYALIPTGQGIQMISTLDFTEQEVFYLIAKRFLSIFFPPAVYEKQSLTLSQGKETFTASGSVLSDPGYLTIYGTEPKDEDRILVDAMQKVQGTVPAVFTIKEGKTKVPGRYTSGSIILAMENAGKLIEDEALREQIKGSGIGTSATRAAILEKLQTNQYITVAKGTQVIRPTKFGELIYEILKCAVPTILNPAYTASWESGLQMVADGKVSEQEYLDKIDAYIRACIEQIKQTDYTQDLKKAHDALDLVYGKDDIKRGGSSRYDTGLRCPFCGKILRESLKSPYYYCPGFQDKSCSFLVPTTMKSGGAQVKIPASALQEMIGSLKKQEDGSYLSGVTKRPVKGFMSKAGKNFEAKLSMSVTPEHMVRYNYCFDQTRKGK